MLKLCPKAHFLFFLFSHVIPWGLKEVGDIHHPALFSCDRKEKQLLIAMWERDPTSRVLAGQGQSGIICLENLS